MNARPGNTQPMPEGMDMDRMNTARDRLLTKYRRLMVLSLACALFVIIGFVPMAAAFTPYFLIAAAMDFLLQRKVGAIDPVNMTVAEVASRARECRRLHHIFQLILIPLALILVGLLVMTYIDDDWMLRGVGAGAAIGVAAGLVIYFGIMGQYRRLTGNKP